MKCKNCSNRDFNNCKIYGDINKLPNWKCKCKDFKRIKRK